MAKAGSILGTKEKLVIEETQTGIQLDMNMEEANFLFTIVGKLNGHNPGETIYSALKAAGAERTKKYITFPAINVAAFERGDKV